MLLASLLLGTATLRAQSASDDFDRPDSDDLGPDWVEPLGGGYEIQSERGKGPSTIELLQHAWAGGAYHRLVLRVDAFAGISPFYPHVGLVCAIGDGADMLYFELLDLDSDGAFDHLTFYSRWGEGWGSQYATNTTFQADAVRMVVSFTNDGDTAVVELDWDFDGVPEERHENHGLLTAGLDLTGTAVGIGTAADARFDNWSVLDAPWLTVTDLVAGQTAQFRVQGLLPGDSAVLAFSRTGGGPTPSPFGDLLLTPPVTAFPSFAADQSGVVSVPAAVPPGALGQAVWFQALHVESGELSNGLAEVVQ